MRHDFGIEFNIHSLVRTIQRLLSISSEEWVSWEQIAESYRPTTTAPILSSYARLPKWQHLFCTDDSKVKLSPQGIQFAKDAMEKLIKRPKFNHKLVVIEVENPKRWIEFKSNDANAMIDEINEYNKKETLPK